MKITNILFVLLLGCHFLSFGQTKKINGVSFVASRDTISANHIKPVLDSKSNFVALMPFGFIKQLAEPEVRYNTSRQWFGETKNGLLQYAKKFHEKGIKVMVKPQIWVWRGQYTGLIEMETEENWRILEKSYAAFIVSYAKAAQEINADIFCIGTELEKFVSNRPEFWQTLIRDIRGIYKGKLTYAANWDEFKRVPFWKQLDYIGIDAYFPLSDKKTPTVQDFETGWKSHKAAIIAIQKKNNKPILFTEYGYRSIDFNGKEPWDSNRVQGKINLEAQVNGLKAIHQQFWNEKWFAGGFIWKWFHKHEQVGGQDNNRFTPQNKPAEETLRLLYGLN